MCLDTVLGSKFQRVGPTWGSQSNLNHVCMGAGVELRSTTIHSYCLNFESKLVAVKIYFWLQCLNVGLGCANYYHADQWLRLATA